MTTTPDDVLSSLTKARAERKDIPDLPHSMSAREVNDYVRATTALDHRITAIRSATTTLADLEPKIVALMVWREKLAKWRKPLCDALLALPSNLRDSHQLGVKRNLELSILTIDQGLRVLQDTGYDLTNLRLGELMRADGYVAVGGDKSRHYSGEIPFAGPVKETEQHIKTLTKQRDDASAILADALTTDDARAKRDAEAAAYRQTLNSMNLRNSDDGSYLVPVRDDGSVIPESELTREQRAAISLANAVGTPTASGESRRRP